MHITETPEPAPDFFISRAGADAAFAAEIGRILEDDGKTVVLQQWDFSNRNFIERMHWALGSGARVIALLSNDYLASDHCSLEWQSAIAHDPLNRNGRLIVLRVAESTPIGVLPPLAYWDLVPVRDNRDLVRDIVLAAVRPGRHEDAGAIEQYWRAARPVVHPEIRPTSSFTGREHELASLHDLLWSGETTAITQPVAAHGLGGIGKSALAREYAHRHQSDYAGVWWLNAAKPEDGTPGFEGVERALVELGAVFIRGLELAEDRARAARRALDLIAHGGFEKPWLLVYDNVDHARVLREWAPAGNAQVLMTTRIAGWPTAIRTMEVEEWPLPEAIAYLRAESGRADLSEAGAGEVSEALGRLPLALSHAAALLRARPNVTAAAYVEQLARRMAEAPKDAEYPRAVFATFQEALAEAEREAPGTIAVMSLAAFFAPDDIPEELFRQPPECYPPDLAELVRAAGAVDDAIGALAHLSLVDFDPERRTFSAHRLVLAAARDALADAAPHWSNSALRTMVSAFPVPEPRTWPACERLVPHVRVVAAHMSEDSPALARLLGTAGTYLQERAALGEVVLLYERSLEIFERLAAADPDNAGWQNDLSVSQERIGDVLSAQGNLPEALESYWASLAIVGRLAAVDPGNARWRLDLSVSHSKIGDVLSARGNLPQALESYGASLAIVRRLAAADPGNAGWQNDLSVSQEKIGDVLRDWRKLDQALERYRASLAIKERLAAADPGNAGWQRNLSVSHNKIGDVLSARRNLGQALESYRASLALVERLAAADPGNAGWQRDLSVSHSKIGDVLSDHGNLGQARESYRTSLAIAERLAAADSGNADWQRDLALGYGRIAAIDALQDERERALAGFRQGRTIIARLREASPDHSILASDLAWFDAEIAKLGG